MTKGELAAYCEAVAPVMIPHLQGRPVTMERYPSGIGRKGFWQKNVSRGFPEWLQRVEVPKKNGVVRHPLATGTRSLVWMAYQTAVTLHVWPSRVPGPLHPEGLFHPDVRVFDLDPPGDDLEAARAATLQVRDLLGKLGLQS
jgi:bifunctional non-homologous end joining protein LigD